jgi:DNA topoisomerase-2
MNITELIDNEYKPYAVYTVEHRAIPNLMDGLKPVQRFLVYAVNKAGSGQHKNADIAGRIAGYGYAHGEVSAQDALAKLAANWNNQIPLFNQHGSFGSRYVQKAAAARYIYVSKNDAITHHFDEKNSVEAEDPDIKSPAFYLPRIPWVLVNGIQGIAVGYASLILPRDVVWVKKAIIAILEHRPCPFIPVYDLGSGSCWFDPAANRYVFEGVIESVKKYRGQTKVVIRDIPWGYDREKYNDVLDKLELDDKILDFYDESGKDGFKCTVTLSEAQAKAFEKDQFGYLKLRKTFTENLTTITHDGKIKCFANTEELIREWVKVRLYYYDIEKQRMLAEIQSEIRLGGSLIVFMADVITGKFKPWELKSKQALEIELKTRYGVDSDGASMLSSIPVYKFTSAELKKVSDKHTADIGRKTKLEQTTPQTMMKENLK